MVDRIKLESYVRRTGERVLGGLPAPVGKVTGVGTGGRVYVDWALEGGWEDRAGLEIAGDYDDEDFE